MKWCGQKGKRGKEASEINLAQKNNDDCDDENIRKWQHAIYSRLLMQKLQCSQFGSTVCNNVLVAVENRYDCYKEQD